jgi:peptide/nickel transport system permease protein
MAEKDTAAMSPIAASRGAHTTQHNSEFRRIVRVFFGRKLAVVGLVIIGILVLMAIFAPLLAPYDPIKTNMSARLQSPSAEHWLGTDSAGRDLMSRIIYGSRTSLIIGLIAVSFSTIVGMTMGICAGYFGGWVQAIIMRFADALMVFPNLILVLLIAGLVGGGIKIVIFALAIGGIAGKCRLMCAQAMTIKQNDYVMAGKAMGMSNMRMMLTQILPNAFPPLLVVITMQLGTVILGEASLSFLGVGILPPTPAWGRMVNEGYKYLLTNPWLSLAPGIAIMLVVFGFNMAGDGLRDAIDPRLRGIIK